jgi:hypothetical protein
MAVSVGVVTYSETDIERSARFLLEILGAKEAWIHAACCAVETFEARNTEDHEAWCRIAEKLAAWTWHDAPVA